jgi:hypothetical protein
MRFPLRDPSGVASVGVEENGVMAADLRLAAAHGLSVGRPIRRRAR